MTLILNLTTILSRAMPGEESHTDLHMYRTY